MYQKNEQGTYDKIIPNTTASDNSCYLTEETAKKFNLPSTSVPNDVLNIISNKLFLIGGSFARVNITIKDQRGKAISGVYVDNVVFDDGTPAKTNSSGIINGLVKEGTVELKIVGYADIIDFSKTFTFVKGETYNETLTVTTRNFIKITTSRQVRFSGATDHIDYSLTGGGAGGGKGYGKSGSTQRNGGDGGNGGTTIINRSPALSVATYYKVSIGAGGKGAVNDVNVPGKNGGTSTFMNTSAPGGQGKGGAKGAFYNSDGGIIKPSQSGKDGSQGFSSFTETVLYGGGGGGGGCNGYQDVTQGANGGRNFGAHGGNYNDAQPPVAPEAGSGGGGGGGWGAYKMNWYDQKHSGGDGASGNLSIRIYLKN